MILNNWEAISVYIAVWTLINKNDWKTDELHPIVFYLQAVGYISESTRKMLNYNPEFIYSNHTPPFFFSQNEKFDSNQLQSQRGDDENKDLVPHVFKWFCLLGNATAADGFGFCWLKIPT